MDLVLQLADTYVFDALYPAQLARDALLRQTISIAAITLVGGAVMYLSGAGFAYVFTFDKALRRHPRFLKQQERKEIMYALSSIPGISALMLPWFLAEVRGYSQLYTRVSDFGWPYLVFSVAWFLVFTDMLIYWFHRWLHHPRVYARIHKPHHKWIVPTPFASHAFHPLDGFLQGLPYHLYVMVFPLHRVVFLVLFAAVYHWINGDTFDASLGAFPDANVHGDSNNKRRKQRDPLCVVNSIEHTYAPLVARTRHLLAHGCAELIAMGLLRDAFDRSAESARQLRLRLATASSSAAVARGGVDTPVATPSGVTPAEDDDTTLRTPQQQQLQQVLKAAAAPPPPQQLHKQHATNAVGSNVARLTQLVHENPPARSVARVVKRKYQSVARERERIAMLASKHNSNSSSAHRTNELANTNSLESHCELLDTVEQYEVEFPKQPDASLGIELETDFYGRHTVIKHLRHGSVAYTLAKTSHRVLRAGHVVVALNGRDLSTLAFDDVLRALKQAADTTRVIRFVVPTVLPMKLYKYERLLVNRDQYGFAKDDAYILSYRKQLRKRTSMSYPHEKKWTDFVQRVGGLDVLDDHVNACNDDAMDRKSDAIMRELRTLVLSGVPVVLRPRIWSLLAGVKSYRRKFGAHYFEHLVAERESSPSVADIEKDVCRTYPEHPFFQTEKGKRELKNVLCAYSLHNASVGYCQSMNFIAGMLLLFMDEADAFWLLCKLLHSTYYLCAENYATSMVGTQTDQRVFQWLVAHELPAVALRLERDSIQIELVTLHWFLCAFVCTLPTETALRVWDWFFLDGERVLFAVAIGILKLSEDRILGAKTHSELHTVVRGLGTDLHDEDALVRFVVAAMAPAESDAAGHKCEEPRTATAVNELMSAAPMTPARFEHQVESANSKEGVAVVASPTRSLPASLFQQLFQTSSPSETQAANRSLDVVDESTHTQHRQRGYRLTFTMDEIEQKRKAFRHEIEAKTQQSQ